MRVHGGSKVPKTPLRNTDGSPTRSNPGFVDALPGPSYTTGVPNFVIRKFRVPIFLLPIYQAAGIQYGIRWEVLAAINEIETDYGRNLNVSSAGALGLDAVHALHLADVRHRREQGRQEGPLQPRRRDLRRRPLPQGRGLREGRPPLDLCLQPRRLVRRLGDAPRTADRRRPRRPRRIAHRPHRRPLPRRRPRPLRRRPPGEGRHQARQGRRERRQRGGGQGRPPHGGDLRQGRLPRRRHQRRRGEEDRPQQEARPLRDPPGRVRQPLHVRGARRGLAVLPGAEGRAVGVEDQPEGRERQDEEGSQARASRPRAAASPKKKAREPRRGRRRAGRGEAAPVREPEPPGRPRERRLRADHGGAERRQPRDLRRALRPAHPPRPQALRAAPAAQGRAGDRRHRARPDRRSPSRARARTWTSRSARRARARRGSTRSRSSTAGSCSRPPRSTARRAATPCAPATAPAATRSGRSC